MNILCVDDLRRPDLLPQRVAELLREAILDGRLPPGARLIEQKLAEQWKISRAPLREAIRQIASEGLVTLTPRRGASVSEVTTDGLAELFAVRGMMEAFAARLAAERATPVQIELMRGIVSEMGETFRRKDLAGFYVAGLQFHDVLIASAGNDMLARMYDQAKQQFRRYQATMPRLPHLQEDSTAEHRRILDAIERGDSDAASAASEQHIRHLTIRFTAA